MNILLLGEIDKKYIAEKLGENYYFFDNYDTNEIIDIIVVRGANFDLKSGYLKKHKNLKAIYVLGIGTDNIDLNYCKDNDILVSNEPTISTYSVAELTVSMLIAGARYVFTTGLNIKNGLYSRKPMGYNLTGKKIGILGYGNIGKLTIRLLKAFSDLRGFELAVYDINPNQYDNYLSENNIRIYDNFTDFVKNIDYLVIHIFGGEQNMNLINKKVLENSNIKGIVNTARKGIVNENDVLEFLNSDKLDFYVTDVVNGEPNAENISKQLLEHRKVFITPHIGANTYQIQKDLLDSLVSKIKKLCLN